MKFPPTYANPERVGTTRDDDLPEKQETRANPERVGTTRDDDLPEKQETRANPERVGTTRGGGFLKSIRRGPARQFNATSSRPKKQVVE